MWSRMPAKFVAKMLGSHLVLGLAASVLLYILCLSGTVMVFHEEFARMEQPAAPEFSTYGPETIARAAENVLKNLDEPPHHFYIGMPVAAMPRLIVTADEQSWFADAQGQIQGEVAHGWADFLQKLHYYLTLPGVLGLTLVGIFGMLMTALVISGVFAHPRLFRDAFRLRLRAQPHLREADIHNRLSVWGLPFHFAIAVSGAALGLASIAAFVWAPAVSDGDTETLFAPVFGSEIEGSQNPADLANIERGLQNFNSQYPDLIPWYVSMHDPMTEGQTAEILAQHPRRLIYGDNYAFDSAGNLTGHLGLSDGPIGQQLVAAIYPLHFGSFGGLVVKILYGIFGLMSTVVVASGVNIWLIKRRKNGRAVPMMERAWQATVWGTPLMLAVIWLLESSLNVSLNTLVAVFWSGLLVLLLGSGWRIEWDKRRVYRRATAAVLVVALVQQWVAHGDTLFTPLFSGISLTILGLAFLLVLWPRQRDFAALT